MLLVVATATLAQHALDANLSVYGRYNAPRPRPAMNKPIYTVNRNTGEMVYNRANAFNDPVYSIYQRHSIDRFNSPTWQGASTGANAAMRSGSQFDRAAYRNVPPPQRPVASPSPARPRPSPRTDPVESMWSVPVETSARAVSSFSPDRPQSYSWGESLAPPAYTALPPVHRSAPPASSPAPTQLAAAPASRALRTSGYSVADDRTWGWR